jgi:DNA mismatch repair protein MutS2
MARGVNKMIYPDSFEEKIGFDQIRQLIEAGCSSSLGIEKVKEMAFSTNYESIIKLLNLSEEFVRIKSGYESFPECHFFDLRSSLKKTRIEGVWLDQEDVFNLRKSLDSIRQIVGFLKNEERKNQYPCLFELASETPVFPEVIKRIDSILTNTGEIKDNASSELANIRRELTSTMNGLSRRLHQILKQAQNEGFIDKDTTPSMREGRLVIPVAPAFKRKIKGIVHDESATGKTIYIEPEELVEANNRIRELQNEERREIIRILILFTDSIRSDAPEMIRSYALLAEVDFLNAKAKLSATIGAVKPRFDNEPCMEWERAVHPLLHLSLIKHQKQVVPLSIFLNEKNRILIISGPNAGGKSVCLKTVGLLQYMLQCGMMIPLHDSSRTGLFERLFVDIGDEQSIENDLSTYSSHLLNMKHFLKFSQEKTLILIDEFGSGTEPKIGGAIAEACLDRFNRQKSFGVITTHYSNLKHYADDHEGVLNGAMLYDRHEMMPLFKLEIGRPGSSFAVEIARKIGLPDDVIADASEMVGSDYIDMDRYLQDIVRDKRYWENKRQQIRIQEKKAEELATQLEQDISDIKNKRKDILSNAKSEAQRILYDSNAIIENTVREIKEAQAEKEKTRILRQELQNFKSKVSQDDEVVDEIISRKIEKIRRKEEKKKINEASNSKEKYKQVIKLNASPKIITFSKNDFVRMKGQQSVGTILSIKGDKAHVAFGSIKSTISLSELEHAQPKKEKENPYTTLGRKTSDDIREKKLNFKQEIDVRGMRGDEALQTVMYFIDDAIMTGVSRVRILHGTGTGVLRQMIRQYLGSVQGVKDYHDEHVQFGGAGITVIDLE